MTYLTAPVIYLELKDFKVKSNGEINLKHFKNKICVVMVQANYCGHCNTAKPQFQKFANNNRDVVCLTIQGDGDSPDAKELVQLITKMKPSFQGFPEYLLFKDGKLVDKEINGRDEAALEEFIKV